MCRGRALLATAALLVVVAWTFACNADGPTVVVRGANGEATRVTVEVVDTPGSRELGLMYRDALAPDSGMLFVFPDAEPRSFWMRNTKIPLDIIFLDAQGRIACVHERTVPFSQAPLRCQAPVRFVLEVAAGFAGDHAVRTGGRVDLGALEHAAAR